MSAITLSSVSKHYGPVAAAESVSLYVEEGELVTILGPSGSGKTTLLMLVAGLIEPTAGRIDIGGRDVTWLPPAKRNVGLVFQSYALFPHMSVFDNIAFPLATRRLPRAEIERRVGAALELVRLTGLERRRPSQLSGGQQQRVALSRAFVFEPEILLLDEPLAALDRKLREEVQVELRHLQRSLGITTILVTHDQEEALSLSDRIVVLDQGRIQQIGTPEEVYLRPVNRFVADFLGTANFFEGPLLHRNGAFGIAFAESQFLECDDPGVDGGTEVCAVLRPERIELQPKEKAAKGGIAATVNDAIYLGQSVRYHLRTVSGHEIIVASPDRGARFPPGSEVNCTWQARDLWIIPDGRASDG